VWRLKQRPQAEDVFPETPGELSAEIAELSADNRRHRDRRTERRLLKLRHVLGMHLLDADHGDVDFATPALDRLPEAEDLPEIAVGDVTPELLRAGILRDGCLLVRGLVDRSDALRLAEQIDLAFAERARDVVGERPAEGYYEEFSPHERFLAGVVGRPWVRQGGGLLAADSPVAAFEMMEVLEHARVPELVELYLGEPALMSVEKTTLRKAEPSVPGAWHQDGSFLGEVRSLNLWLSLSRCGYEAPGLDIVPRRLDGLVRPWEDRPDRDIVVTPQAAQEAAGSKSIMRPIFEPGDAILFDELFLHQTATDPAMLKPRFALESWFFGSSAFPADYVPIAL
jgi:hypothetical protein